MKKIMIFGILLVLGMASMFAEDDMLVKTKSKEGYVVTLSETLMKEDDPTSKIYMLIVMYEQDGRAVAYLVCDDNKPRIMGEVEIFEQKGFESAKADILKFCNTNGVDEKKEFHMMNLTRYSDRFLLYGEE